MRRLRDSAPFFYIKLYIIYIYRAWRDDGLSRCTCCCRVYVVQVSVFTHTTMPACLPACLALAVIRLSLVDCRHARPQAPLHFCI